MKAILAQLAQLALTAIATVAAAEPLVSPNVLIADARLSKGAREALTLAPRRYYTFWNSGDERLAKAALSPNFIDHTLPKARAQGPEGPLMASRAFRAVVPDLTCEVEQMIVTGRSRHRVPSFSWPFQRHLQRPCRAGAGCRFLGDRHLPSAHNVITEDWHLEDNLTLLRQLGVVAP